MQLAVNLFTGPLGDFEIRTSKEKFQTMILSARFSAFRMCFILCPKDETISMPKSLTLTDSLGNTEVHEFYGKNRSRPNFR